MSAAEQLIDEALDAKLDAWVAEMWRRGDLSWKLDEHQKRVYDQYREWESIITDPANAVLYPELFKGMRRVFVMDISRRWGKTYLVALIRIEDCIRRQKQTITYATAFQKDIGEIIQPMIEDICSDAPADCCPKFQRSFGVQTMAYRFPNGSLLKLVGIDKNPRGLRGRASDGFNVTEAGHVPKLASTLGNVVYPQFQRRPHATLILESNAPEVVDHDFDRVFIPDARARNDNGISALVERTIDDNEAISEAEKREFLEAAEAIDPYGMRREYYGERVRDPRIMVIPEFDLARHVVPPPPMPEYAIAGVAMDPGEEDPLGLVFAYWDFLRAKFVVQRSHAESNMRTGAAADYIKTTETELWGVQRFEGPRPMNDPGYKRLYAERKGNELAPGGVGLWYWDGEKFVPNPVHRWSDTDARMIGDLSHEHGLMFLPTEKKDFEHSTRNLLRHAFQQDLIEICDDAGCIINQLQSGQFRKDSLGKFVDYVRSPALGHLDALQALMYLWRMFQAFRFMNPFPPAVVDLKAPGVAFNPWHDSGRATTAETKLRDAIRGKRLTRWSPR